MHVRRLPYASTENGPCQREVIGRPAHAHSLVGSGPEPYGGGMSAKLRVPSALQASMAAGGAAHAEWLAALPDRVDELAARWGLRLGEPFEPGGSAAWAAPGTDPDG